MSRQRTLLAATLAMAAAFGAPLRAQEASRVLVRSWDDGPSGTLSADRGANGVWQRMLKLRTIGSVLYTTAHPDDEHAGTLTRLSRGEGVRTALLTLNRGEGGANAIGPELFDALGLIRTEELRLSGRYYGLDDQYFTTAVDYGYSKTYEEALRSWDREQVLEDMVRVIRLNRPFVVISRFHGSSRDGHGHHQAAGILTPEAVEAAADPTRFPEQIEDEFLRPWRVRKLYRGGVRLGETAHVEYATDGFSPWLGDTFGSFGSYGLSLQRSQTQGRMRGGRGTVAAYELLSPSGRDEPEEDFFDGLFTSVGSVFLAAGEETPNGAAGPLARAEQAIGAAFAAFSMEAPWQAAPHLAEVVAELRTARRFTREDTDARYLLDIEIREARAALSAAIGITVSAIASPEGLAPGAPMAGVTPGQVFDVHVSVARNSPLRFSVRDITIRPNTPTSERSRLIETDNPPNDPAVSALFRVAVPRDADPSRPWFSRSSIAQNHYAVTDPEARHLGESPEPFWVSLEVTYANQRLELAVPIRMTEPAAPYGATRPALPLLPALSVRATPGSVVVPPGQREVAVSLDVTSHMAEGTTALVGLDLPEGWRASPSDVALRFETEGESQRVDFTVSGPPEAGSGAVELRARASTYGRTYSESVQTIRHRDLETKRLYADAIVTIVPVDVVTPPGLTVGYVMGVGDDVPAAITHLGAEVRLLTAEDLATGTLSDFDAILVGTRAYAVRPDLVANNRRLLDYASGGGNVVVLYQTQEYVPNQHAPFPASLPRNAQEVSEEDAPVRILAPDHPLLTTPNRITDTDFEKWIEQRGSKHFAEWSPEYTPLIETHDTGQEPQEGVWLHARVGDGHFTYASIALHRQLPYGVPGAYRILANLISLGR